MAYSSEVTLKQLGGGKFLAMTGAKDLLNDERNRTLSMKLPATLTKGRGNYLTVRLMEDDTYKVTLYKYRKLDLTQIGFEMGIYAEDLQASFTRLTGLDTSL